MKKALEILSQYRPNSEAWPKSPRGLGDILRRNQPGLKAIGIKVEFHPRNNKGVHISISSIPFFQQENSSNKRYTQSTPHTPDAVTAGLSDDKNECTLVKPMYTHPGQHTPDTHNVHPTYTPENPVVTGKSAHGVCCVYQNDTQILPEKKDMHVFDPTPLSNDDVVTI
jgi:hypothetical protein